MPKITLEFEDEADLHTWVLTKAKEFVDKNMEEREALHVSETHLAVESTSRRKYWSEVDIQFVKDYYLTKSVPWIAKQLRRRKIDVYAKLAQLYKAGLPKKRARNGKVKEE